MDFIFNPFVVAFLGGFLPVMVWLWFLEHEDKHPEPKKLTVYAFLGGMVAVLLVLPFQYIAQGIADENTKFFIWAATEEIIKLIVAYVFVLRRIENDEPIDSLMYLIITALGFAALENALYLLQPLRSGHISEAFITGNFRFMGATLLHVVSSSIIGIALAKLCYDSLLHRLDRLNHVTPAFREN
ncbi:PrsW family intramembrane metalloprotease [Candidatus Parcubacteria bacterium]|nr:PrsW family intramembrane metalloprotease [Candidatus Parcubacteria bacterium]